MSRLEPLLPERMTPAQREAQAEIVAARTKPPEGRHAGVYDAPRWSAQTRLGGPFEPWLRSPELARRLVDVGGVLRFGTSLPARLTELAILVSARHWTAQFEWYAHSRMARRAGIDDKLIEAIRSGAEPELTRADDIATYRFARELLTSGRVGDATYAELLAQVGEAGVVELVALLGYYSLVSMTLNVFEVPLPDGEPLPLE